MWFLQCHQILLRLSHLYADAPALVVTLGAAVLIACATGCACGPAEEKDDIFHNRIC
jgi:hypothetical protein